MGNKINETFLDRSNISYEYNFDGNGNDTAGGADATVNNATWVSADGEYSEEMIDLNGSSTYATASHSFSGNFTICGAIKFDAFNSNNEAQIYRITGAGSTNIGFSHNNISSLNQFQLFTNDGTTGSSLLLTTLSPIVGRWYYICASGDGVNRVLKVKDLETNINYSASTTVAPSVTMSGTANLFRHPTAGRYLNGQCNGMTIYNNYAISDNEFEALALKWRRKLGPTGLRSSYPKDGLVLNYDAEDITLDTSGNGNNGTNNNVLTQKVGQQNVGVYNGSNSSINTGVESGLTFSFSGWVNYDDVSVTTNTRWANERGTAGESAGWYFRTISNGNNKLRFDFFTTGGINRRIDDTVDLEANKWYHQVITIDDINKEGKLYKNGVLIGTASFTGSILNGTGGINLGNQPTSFFPGKIGLIKTYNKTLSQTEIDDLYYEGRKKLSFPKYSLRSLESSKVLEISRPANSGTYYDQTGNGNNGTATNVTDSTVGLNNVMNLSSGSITWTNTSFLTALCWEQISGKWVLQENPAYITSTGVSAGTRTISNIVLYNRVLSSNEIYQFRYGNTII